MVGPQQRGLPALFVLGVCEHVVPPLDKQLLGAVLLTQPRLDHGLSRRFGVADLPVLPLHHPDDALARRLAQPWYQTKTEPSFEDMITKLRKTLIVARFTPASPGQPNPDLLHDYALACAAAAA